MCLQAVHRLSAHGAPAYDIARLWLSSGHIRTSGPPGINSAEGGFLFPECRGKEGGFLFPEAGPGANGLCIGLYITRAGRGRGTSGPSDEGVRPIWDVEGRALP